MKKIALNPQHMQMLLEMCSSLFPEYDIIKYDNPTLFILFYKKDRKKPHLYQHRIYWFELCMMELAEKLFFGKVSRTNKDEYLNYVWEANLFWEAKSQNSKYADHPIDYLYKVYKSKK